MNITTAKFPHNVEVICNLLNSPPNPAHCGPVSIKVLMNRRIALPVITTVAAATAMFSVTALAREPSHVPPSIHVNGKLSKAECARLARISFDDALKDAHAALPGKVVNGELEAEDGGLQYSFEILDPNTQQIAEVEIDAGDGHVLNIDRNDKD